ncbi:MAG: TSUP family transporter [Planctomycetota bacterium]|nr:TSUP family transporter [Planctomycetota bacterium]
MHTFTPGEFALCTIIAFIAGLIDAMAGGGGIFTMPTLAALGLPVPNIAGTNKFVGCSGSSTATISFLARGKIDRVVGLLGGVCSLTGSIFGALALVHLGKLNEPLTKGVFGGLLLFMALYMFFRPKFGGENHYEGPTARNLAITIAAGLILGFYDGFFGPGTGSFLVFVMVRVLLFDFVIGTGNAKAMNFGSNIGSLMTFIVNGLVVWPIAIPMGIANAAGSWVGSTLAIKQGAKFVRWAFLFAAIVIAARMFWFLVTGK